jgi:hypothetical protein
MAKAKEKNELSQQEKAGSKGGTECFKLYGSAHFRKLAAKRKHFRGGRPPKKQDAPISKHQPKN